MNYIFYSSQMPGKYKLIHIRRGNENMPLIVKKYRVKSGKALKLGKREIVKNITTLPHVYGGWITAALPFLAPIATNLIGGIFGKIFGRGIQSGGMMADGRYKMVGPGGVRNTSAGSVLPSREEMIQAISTVPEPAVRAIAQDVLSKVGSGIITGNYAYGTTNGGRIINGGRVYLGRGMASSPTSLSYLGAGLPPGESLMVRDLIEQ